MRLFHVLGLLLLPNIALSQADLDVVLKAGDQLQGTDLVVGNFTQLRSGVRAGWLCRTTTQSLSTGELRYAIVGDRTPDGSAGPSLLRLAGTFAGVDQRRLEAARLAHGRVGYVSSPNLSMGIINAAWVENDLIAQRGDVIPSLAREWLTFEGVRPLAGTGAMVLGNTNRGAALVQYPSQAVLLESGSVLGTGGLIVSDIASFRVSPNGQHWVARVSVATASGEREALVVDGDLLTLGGGPTIEGMPLPSSLAVFAWSWGTFGTHLVHDNGALTFEANVTEPNGTRRLIVRSGRSIEWSTLGTQLDLRDSFDPAVALIADDDARLFVDTVQVGTPAPTIDVDGDGSPDAGYGRVPSTGQFPSFLWKSVVTSAGIIEDAAIDTPSGETIEAIMQLRRRIVGASTCPGVASSTGRPARLALIGQTEAAGNDIALLCTELPRFSAGLGLVSPDSGFVAMPGGSDGNLCLGGGIGRFVGQTFQAGEEGRGVITVDLESIPQPTGSAAAIAGENWFFQVWYRDLGSRSNFSNAVTVLLD